MLGRKKKNNKKDGFFNVNTGTILPKDLDCSLESFSYVSYCEDLFLKRFDQDEIFAILKNSGILEQLNLKGYSRISADFLKDESDIHQLKIYHDAKKTIELLVSIRISESKIVPFKTISHVTGNLKYVRFLTLEWVSTEDPKGVFTKKKPQLPGQKYPGLEILPQIITFLRALCREVLCDGILLVADHFHAVYMYSSYAFFADPSAEGRLRAAMRDLGRYGLYDVTWGFMTGTVQNRLTGAYESFVPAPQIIPVMDRLTAHFNTRKYLKIKNKALEENAYTLDIAEMEKKRKEILKKNSPAEL